jgi:hypothetical protein
MKKSIELLKEARDAAINGSRSTAVSCIEEAMAELKARPRWETPEQYEKRTGRHWLENWAVYFNAWFSNNGKSIYINNIWHITTQKEARNIAEMLKDSKRMSFTIAIICATEAGPPPGGWWPGEE